jgi:hypothetical protein
MAIKDKHYNELHAKITKHLNSAEPDVLIIKTHLICEYYLSQLIALENGSFLKLNFPDKVSRAIKHNEQTCEILRLLNTLRNKIGHELNYTLSESDIDSLGYKLYSSQEYVIKKYDYENEVDLLRAVLIKIVIKLAVLVEIKVEELKPKTESTDSAEENEAIVARPASEQSTAATGQQSEA